MRYFITYGDLQYQKSKERISAEANASGYFDMVKSYGPVDLSPQVKNSELLGFRRGGGLWVWKPDVIYKTLLSANEGDVVVYADSGCTVLKNDGWERYFRLLDKSDGLFFLLNTKVKEYTRRSVLDHFADISGRWEERYQLGATFIVLKRTENTLRFVSEWLDLMLKNPEYVKDVDPEKRKYEYQCFVENRHDQSLLTGLCYQKFQQYNLKILWNTFEGGRNRFLTQPLVATRISDDGSRSVADKGIVANLAVKFFVLPIRTVRHWYLMQR